MPSSSCRSSLSSRIFAFDSARRLLFPCCSRCVAHVAVWEAGTTISTLVACVGVVGALAMGFLNSGRSGLFAFGYDRRVSDLRNSARVVQRTRALSTGLRRCRERGHHYGWSGSTSAFSFASVTYTAEFAERNQAILVT